MQLKDKIIFVTACCILVPALCGCVKKMPVETPAQTEGALPAEKSSIPAQPLQPSPRVQASFQLTEQGRLLLVKGQADNAIRTLEQAISLNPGNGQNYYYLSEAWLLKDNFNEAREFNRLAELHFTADEDWMRKVAEQAERIAAAEK